MTTTKNEGMVCFSETINAEDDEERRGGGIVEAQPIPDSSPGRDDDVKRRKGGRLSLVSQQYDIDGDGQLDEAQLASESVKPVLFVQRLIVLFVTPLALFLWLSALQLICISAQLRNLDRSGRGYLTNEKVYGLMTEQLAMQSKIFQFKKIIIR